MTNRILIIEDDRYQTDEIERCLRPLGVGIERVSTELSFHRLMRESAELPYKLAVVDMMLRWTDPSPDMEEPPPHIIEEGFYTAGLRCCRELASRGVRCLIFTALDKAKIPLKPNEMFPIINKSEGYATLADRVKRLLEAR